MLDSTKYSQIQDRVVSVFISSTFVDMNDERERLIKFVFPELRRRCRKRGVEFTGVDLRWGITDEQKAEGKVLPICLREIERCRPFFIGLLGERYGWVPEYIDNELIEVQQWLNSHKGKSVTELEILHGVLKNTKMKGLSYFYIRNKKVSNEIEQRLSKHPQYVKEPVSSKAKLETLKEKIVASGYPVRVDYTDVKTLGDMVLEDLWKAIDERYPEAEVPSKLEQRRLEHDAFASLRRNVYIGRDDYIKTLNDHVVSDNSPLVLLGESGSGKSALIANWVEEYRKNNPDDFIIPFYIGSTSESSDYAYMLRQIMVEIKERYGPNAKVKDENGLGILGIGSDNEIPIDPKEVIATFPRWLLRAGTEGKFILILDGLNQLEDRDNAPDLAWLPNKIPRNTKLILSTLPGRSLEVIKKRGWTELQVHPMNQDEQKKFITEYLQQYRKELSSPQIEKIIKHEQVANPLYLKTLLEELRIFGIHEELDKKIEHYLKAQSIEELFNRVLERLENNYEAEREGMVKNVTTFLWASRKGLSETELLEILGTENSPMPRAYWSPLYLALEESLVGRSGLLTFFHDFLKKAVEIRYLNSDELKQKAHSQLAEYFRDISDPDSDGSWNTKNARGFGELPYHYTKSKNWQALGQTLCALPFIQKKAQLGMIRGLIDDYRFAESECKPVEKFISDLNSWKNFVYSQAHVIETYINKYPQILFQQAFNLSKKGIVSCSAHDLLGNKGGPSGVWFERVNRPMYPTSGNLTLEGHTDAVHSIALSRDGSIAISGSADGTLRIWSTDNGKCFKVLTGHTNGVHCVQFISENKVISGSWDNSIRLWDIETAECINEFTGHTGPISFLKIVDESRFISGSFDGTLRLWNIETKQCERIFTKHQKAITHAILTDGNRTMVSASEDGALVFWDINYDSPCTIMHTGHGEVLHLTVVPGRRLLASYEDGAILLWDLGSLDHSVYHGHDGPVTGTALFSEDTFISWSFDCELRLWSLKTGECLNIMAGHTEPVTDAVVLDDGKALSVSQDCSLRFWDVMKGKNINVIHGHRAGINVAAHHDSSKVISAGFDNTIKVWDSNTPSIESKDDTSDALPSLISEARLLWRVCLSDEDIAVLETLEPKTIHLWDLKSGKYKEQIPPYSELENKYIKKLQRCFKDQFSYDGSRISTKKFEIAIQAFSESENKTAFGISCIWMKKKYMKLEAAPAGLKEIPSVPFYIYQGEGYGLYPLACKPYAFVCGSDRTIAFDVETREPHVLLAHGLSPLRNRSTPYDEDDDLEAVQRWNSWKNIYNLIKKRFI